ncbi:hypothetical protein EBH_0084610 [Eimeria brunetti]|uniref:Uncharacterized protein n=1 Tax=Eimeria brunetti TaxID=51314 RepID=U6LY60_9EIME|nr:hypothetical protein EBH_0084610 [Eimeria brunetti]
MAEHCTLIEYGGGHLQAALLGVLMVHGMLLGSSRITAGCRYKLSPEMRGLACYYVVFVDGGSFSRVCILEHGTLMARLRASANMYRDRDVLSDDIRCGPDDVMRDSQRRCSLWRVFMHVLFECVGGSTIAPIAYEGGYLRTTLRGVLMVHDLLRSSWCITGEGGACYSVSLYTCSVPTEALVSTGWRALADSTPSIYSISRTCEE